MTQLSAALRLVRALPGPVWRPAVWGLSRAAALRPPRGLRQWQASVAEVTGRRPGRAETARAGASWARNLVESAQLEDWTHADVLEAVVIADEDRTRLVEAHRNGGVVVALPHMGSWDLAGAWACLNGLPVSTVAEQGPDFDYFVGVREALGMKVYGHRDRLAVARLEADQRAGRMVCLVSDRHFGRTGIPVVWSTARGPRQVRMPAGAAHLALRTGATLLGVACHYQGRRMRLVVSEPLVGPDVATLDQLLADFFCDQVRANPVDWHVLQPFFDGVMVP